MIECHGHFRTASCTKCKREFDGKECKRIIVEDKQAPTCNKCKGYVKPDIVFFGEQLPSRYHRMVKKDTKQADLILVMGTCKFSCVQRSSSLKGKNSNFFLPHFTICFSNIFYSMLN